MKGSVGRVGANSVRATYLPDIDALRAGEFEVVATDHEPGECWY